VGDVHFGGDNFGVVNTGPGQATQNIGSMNVGVRNALARVERLLTEHADNLEEGAQAGRDLAEIREEAASDRPDQPRLTAALKRLAERVSSVGVLLAAVKDLAGTLGVPLP
jgi:dihydropteroate synthase